MRNFDDPMTTAESIAALIARARAAQALVDGVIAATTPTGRAISTMPRSTSSAMIPTLRAPCRSRIRPSVFR